MRTPCTFWAYLTSNFNVCRLQKLCFLCNGNYCWRMTKYKATHFCNLPNMTSKNAGTYCWKCEWQHSNNASIILKTMQVLTVYQFYYSVPLHTVVNCWKCSETAVGNVTQWIPVIFAVKRFAVKANDFRGQNVSKLRVKVKGIWIIYQIDVICFNSSLQFF